VYGCTLCEDQSEKRYDIESMISIMGVSMPVLIGVISGLQPSPLSCRPVSVAQH
jgi:hypothetical protein